ncbi:unnamed protein product [Ilex paraguariensis]|uniref:Uncharacterized protein n=1 Tax=Ilex paraguariensis TaxID=185542 RepID=A0ABC8QVS4_9AQUA
MPKCIFGLLYENPRRLNMPLTFSSLVLIQIRLIKELYGNQIGELYHSLPYHMIEFVLDFDCKVTVSLRYADLMSILPTQVSVLAWHLHQSNKSSASATTMNRKGNGALGSHPIPARLSYAEDALRTMSLPEGILDLGQFFVGAYAEIVLNLPQALQQINPERDAA